ncbi:MAG TPA: hypothetical protein VH116_03525 [Gemmatimonadales bacterium]|jgi:hypothetical protein|nr:hypothetical protein [Gemmatimonadales bacterium]
MTRGRGRATGCAIACAVAMFAVPSPRPLRAQDSLPVGFGTLKRDDIVVRFATDQIAVQVLPLAEGVIRLLAPDTYASLKQLLKSRKTQIDSAATRAGEVRPTLVMVTFLGIVPQARFNPEDLSIVSQGRLYRPVAIVPLSPQWSSYQLDAREQAVAIYLFDEGITFRETMTVSYGDVTNDAWQGILPLLERERSRVLARGGLTPRSP